MRVRFLLYAVPVFMFILMASVLPAFADGIPKSIDVFMNSANIMINGKIANIPDINYQNSLFVPLREFSQLLGKKVIWDATTKTVNIVDDPQAETKKDSLKGLNIKNIVKIVAVSLQLAGIILLGQMVLLRKRNDIAILTKFMSAANGSYLGARRLLYETWLSKMGFYYLLTGIVLNFFIPWVGSINMLMKVTGTSVVVFILLLLGWWMCKNKTSKQYPEILRLIRNIKA